MKVAGDVLSSLEGQGDLNREVGGREDANPIPHLSSSRTLCSVLKRKDIADDQISKA